MAVRRGFKTWCEKSAQEFRAKLGLADHDCLPVVRMAKHLGVALLDPSEVENLALGDIAQLSKKGKSEWSAVTIMHPQCTAIIYNSSHTLGRQSNDLMHEMSHTICGHKSSNIQITDDGLMILNEYDLEQEEEADLLSATLLLPRVALVRIMEEGWDLEFAADEYVVSTQLLRMRLQRAGVYKQFERRRKKWET